MQEVHIGIPTRIKNAPFFLDCDIFQIISQTCRFDQPDKHICYTIRRCIERHLGCTSGFMSFSAQTLINVAVSII